MKRQAWIGAVLLALTAAGWAYGEPPPSVAPGPESGWAGKGTVGAPDQVPGCLRQLAPAGGWFPYGGGLLHWWPKHCFPRCGAPDDYCRKPLPSVCWPPYPSYYIWGPPETCCPQDRCRPASRGSP
jgi:hypothetical protein